MMKLSLKIILPVILMASLMEVCGGATACVSLPT